MLKPHIGVPKWGLSKLLEYVPFPLRTGFHWACLMQFLSQAFTYWSFGSDARISNEFVNLCKTMFALGYCLLDLSINWGLRVNSEQWGSNKVLWDSACGYCSVRGRVSLHWWSETSVLPSKVINWFKSIN